MGKIIYIIFPNIIFMFVIVSQSVGVRVCTSWFDYFRPLSKNCFDNPDGDSSNVTQILQRWGCTVEEYVLVTQDHYYILVVRAFLKSVRKKTPIIMGHGIYMNSLGFVVMSNKSIAYQLLVRGHPVFLVNFRGSKYSTSHKTLAKNDSAYWKFSFHQMAQYDLPVVMNLVAQKTGGAKAVYIGFSMGTTVINIYCILYPQEATKRLVGVIEMAPVANLTNIRSIVGILSPSWPILKPIANSIWHGILLPRNDYLKEFCSTHVIGIFLCYTITAFVFGANYAMLDPLRMPVVMQQCPDVISAMVVDHYYQIIRHKQFLQYDYGYEQNIEEYGSPFPHPYNFSEITVPIALFVGLNDFVAEAKNSRILYNNLPSTSRCGFKVIPDSHWTHDAFVFSKDMHLYLNNEILNTIPIMENNLCSQYRHD